MRAKGLLPPKLLWNWKSFGIGSLYWHSEPEAMSIFYIQLVDLDNFNFHFPHIICDWVESLTASCQRQQSNPRPENFQHHASHLVWLSSGKHPLVFSFLDFVCPEKAFVFISILSLFGEQRMFTDNFVQSLFLKKKKNCRHVRTGTNSYLHILRLSFGDYICHWYMIYFTVDGLF